MSDDGKPLTVTAGGTDAAGKSFEQVIVFDRPSYVGFKRHSEGMRRGLTPGWSRTKHREIHECRLYLTHAEDPRS